MTNNVAVASGWFKSSYSGTENACVSVNLLGSQKGLRDDKDPHGGHLEVSPGAYRAFVGVIRESGLPGAQ
jgi:hypothetical protein